MWILLGFSTYSDSLRSNMSILETSSFAIGDGRRELSVGFAFLFSRRIDVRFAVFCPFTVIDQCSALSRS